MLTLHRAERSGALVQALGEVLRTPLADPFAAEVVAVPAQGVERWLSQRLATQLGVTVSPGPGAGDGVCANLVFPSPGRLVAEAVSAATDTDPRADPWAPARLRWSLLEVIDACLGESWCAVLTAHLGAGREDHRSGRRYATAAHLGDLFASYGAHRPGLVLDWLAGHDTDGADRDLDEDLRWQARLWRLLREHVGSASPAERMAGACARLRDDPAVLGLPERLSVFGPTRLSTEQLQVLGALAARRDVHVWLPHPSPAMWDALRAAPGPAAQGGRRREDTSALAVRHPFLAGCARDVRELQLRLPHGPGAGVPVVDVHHPGEAPQATLLGRLQDDLRHDRAPTRVVAVDGTLTVHACHGAPRQVEVLREVLLHLLAEDPDLEPRDVLVMCPDVEAYAPLVRAAFGHRVPAREGVPPDAHDPDAGSSWAGDADALDAHPGHQLRVRLADRSLRRTNPLIDVVARLLELADGRVTASQLLDLAATPPVRRRFGLDDQDLERLRDWAVEAGVRWGLGLRQREAHGLPRVLQNTWTTGLDRILLGVTADEDPLAWLGLALPLDDVDSTDVDLAGRLAELVDRLAGVVGALQGVQPAQRWTTVLAGALDRLTLVPERESWQLSQARRELAAATEHSGTVDLRLADVRALLAGVLAGRPTRANFRTGELTVCTMVPMRSVPHRVVVLLGLDDEVFPRGAGLDGDDVLRRDPCLGERDPRSEDRQLLLDAVMAAQDRLVVLYTGADPVTGAARPPAAPLGELLDVVSTMVGDTSLDAVVTRHPLQPFDPRAFHPVDPFSFDRAALAGARAAAAQPLPRPVFLPGPLPPAGDDVDLGDLIDFLVHPTQAFLRQRLGLRVPGEDEEVTDALRTELDGLAKWSIGERLLLARLGGAEARELTQAEWRRGSLPPLRLGDAVLVDVGSAVEALSAACRPLLTGAARAVDVAVELGGGRRLTGTVTGVHGTTVLSSTYSQLGPRHRIGAWVRLLALACAGPGGAAGTGTDGQEAWQAVATGRGPFRRPVWRSTLRAPADAPGVLAELVDLRDRGMVEPLPMATAASAAYADRRASGGSVAEAQDAAEKQFSSRFGDTTDRHLAYVHGARPSFASLLGEPPPAQERVWAPQEPTRFGVLARRLWSPLLAAESLGPP